MISQISGADPTKKNEANLKSDIHKINNSNLANCFSCHQSKNYAPKSGKSLLYLSHVLESYLFTTEAMLTAKNANNSKTKRIKESEALKVKQFEDFVGAAQ